MSDFITLTCPNCAGKLQITDDINRFACMYCGVEHVVRRGGGIVTLQPVVDELKKVSTGISGVKVGVDRTASELAIQRLLSEIQELIRRREEIATAVLTEKAREKKAPGFYFRIGLESCGVWFGAFLLVAIISASLTANTVESDPSIGSVILSCSLLIVPVLVAGAFFVYRQNKWHEYLASREQFQNSVAAQLSLIDSELARAKTELARHRQLVRQIDN
jgi:hypothetical protein